MSKQESERSLFDRVVAMTGLSPMIGGGMVRRALEHVDSDSWHAGPHEYERAIPHLEVRLLTYLSAEEARARCEEIASVLRHMSSSPPPGGPPGASAHRSQPGGGADGEDESADDNASFRIQRSIRLMQDVRRRLHSTIPPARLSSEPPDED